MLRLRNLMKVGVVLAGALLYLGSNQTASAIYTLTVQEVTSGGALVSTASFSGDETGLFFGGTSGFVTTGGVIATPSFAVSVTGSQNSNVPGTIGQMEMHTLSAGRTADNTNFLRVFLTKDGWGGYPAGSALQLENILSSITPIFGATVTFQSFVDTGDVAFGVPAGTNVPPALGSDSPLVTSGTATATPQITMTSANNGTSLKTTAGFTATGGPLALTSAATITGLAVGQSISFDGNTLITPVPGALVLVASGVPFLFMGRYLRRRKMA
jgi:hypothetical protein